MLRYSRRTAHMSTSSARSSQSGLSFLRDAYSLLRSINIIIYLWKLYLFLLKPYPQVHLNRYSIQRHKTPHFTNKVIICNDSYSEILVYILVDNTD